jgi:hypothetical protein
MAETCQVFETWQVFHLQTLVAVVVLEESVTSRPAVTLPGVSVHR